MFLLFYTSIFAFSPGKQKIEAYTAKILGGASKLTDVTASGRYLVSFTEPGQTVKFNNLPKANKLAIRYTSTKVGTISLVVNDQPSVKVNIHSSGVVFHLVCPESCPSQFSFTS